jgi:hypothetical protein
MHNNINEFFGSYKISRNTCPLFCWIRHGNLMTTIIDLVDRNSEVVDRKWLTMNSESSKIYSSVRHLETTIVRLDVQLVRNDIAQRLALSFHLNCWLARLKMRGMLLSLIFLRLPESIENNL